MLIRALPPVQPPPPTDLRQCQPLQLVCRAPQGRLLLLQLPHQLLLICRRRCCGRRRLGGGLGRHPHKLRGRLRWRRSGGGGGVGAVAAESFVRCGNFRSQLDASLTPRLADAKVSQGERPVSIAPRMRAGRHTRAKREPLDEEMPATKPMRGLQRAPQWRPHLGPLISLSLLAKQTARFTCEAAPLLHGREGRRMHKGRREVLHARRDRSNGFPPLRHAPRRLARVVAGLR